MVSRTAGGGTEYGGLAGSNYGDGDPELEDINDATGSGIHEPEDIDADEDDGYGGLSGGAVGGTPAGKRSAGGGKVGRGIRPNGDHRGDSTIGYDPDTGKEILTLTGHTEEITTVAVSPNGASLLTGSRDGKAIVWLAVPWRDAPTPIARSTN